MMKVFKILIVIIPLLASGCIKETIPQSGSVTGPQVIAAPGAFEGLVSGITSSLVGQFAFGNADAFPWDYGYPSFFLFRDVMGQDITIEGGSWYSTWYEVGTALGPRYLYAQIPWTYYYRWINNCNTVLRLFEGEPSENQRSGLGIAYTMRAMFYMDLARMFQYTYVGNEQAGTVPIVTEETTTADLVNNPRASNIDMWNFILDDLDMAEEYIAGYERENVYTPDLSVVYGLKARAYLTMENWEEAERYAREAQAGYAMLTEAEYLNRMTAFNTPTSAWMFGVTFRDNDPNILLNDADSNWGSHMFLEVEGGLYASAYGYPNRIDAHLYQTIPTTDFRKKCYIDPSLDGMSAADRTAALAAYTDYPQLIDQAAVASGTGAYGYLSLKFRAAGGPDGRFNPYLATVAAVPLMRVEEMMLIEAEAAGMQDEGRGIGLLTAFSQTRDPSYTYDAGTSFRDNVWWQRRVELWGEGFATFDIKRLNKGIIRSYAGTNHRAGYRWNTATVPMWMNLTIVQTEANYNTAIVNNPTPTPPEGDSEPHIW